MIEPKKTARYFTYIEPVLKAPIVKTYGPLIFTILALIIFIIFAIKPTLETIAVLQKELSLQQETLQKITQKSENLSLARKNYQLIDQNTKLKIQAAIPSNPNLATLTKSLEDTAGVTEASISALQVQPFTMEKQAMGVTLQEISFTVNTQGSFNTLKKVLEDLYDSERTISWNNIGFSKIEGSNSLLMSLSGKSYYIK